MDLSQLKQDLLEKGWSASDDLVPKEICTDLWAELLSIRHQSLLKKAHIGRANQKQIDSDVRGDFIYWLDPFNPADTEKKFMGWFTQFVNALNQNLMLGLSDFELHYAFYPPSTQYQKHIDVFKSNSQRKLSFVLYLNQNWQPSDGGELILFEEKNPECESARISPQWGRLVLFLSDAIYHQVNFTNRERFSVTGWLKNRI